jgi:catechol 2,3-dioxygenase-like lactoylglutathione lyase family enzyme
VPRISLTVRDLAAMQDFYVAALGFETARPQHMADPALARLLGAERITCVLLRRGRQFLELSAFDPPGEDYPQRPHSNDLCFQHIALVCESVARCYATLCRHRHIAISRNGPQDLPGGIIACKFRDPEGHPIELIQFPTPDPASAGGIDHSAISVANVDESIAFYTGQLGLTVESRQVNAGPAQEALDNLDSVSVDVVGVSPEQATPHIELLGYRVPKGRPAAASRPSDLAATRLMLRVDTLVQHPAATRLADGSRAALIHDPDGHALLLLDYPSKAKL